MKSGEKLFASLACKSDISTTAFMIVPVMIVPVMIVPVMIVPVMIVIMKAFAAATLMDDVIRATAAVTRPPIGERRIARLDSTASMVGTAKRKVCRLATHDLGGVKQEHGDGDCVAHGTHRNGVGVEIKLNRA
jgi:hypothetical protein